MDEMREILISTATRLFEQEGGDDAARMARRGAFPSELWQAVADAGLPLALLSAERGGFGLSGADALDLVGIGGGFGSPVPLGETMVANWMLAEAGLPPVEGVATFVELAPGAVITKDGASWRVRGEAFWAPWARHAGTIVLLGDSWIVAASAADVTVAEDQAENGLPRDDVAIDTTLPADRIAPRPILLDRETVQAAGALIRAMEMAGALRTVLALTVQYAGERVQFGKPIARLQAIQQQIAVLADQVAAANAAADIAADAWQGTVSVLSVAVAKARVGEAAGIAAAIAHQVHGAIGFTQEHRLHIFTKALWAWRDEFGSELFWQRWLGRRAVAAGGAFWRTRWPMFRPSRGQNRGPDSMPRSVANSANVAGSA